MVHLSLLAIALNIFFSFLSFSSIIICFSIMDKIFINSSLFSGEYLEVDSIWSSYAKSQASIFLADLMISLS